MNLLPKNVVVGCAALGVVALCAWAVLGRDTVLVPAWAATKSVGASMEAPTDAPQDAPTRDIVRLASNASIASMVRVQAVTSTALPATDALAARVAYDDDVTARVTAGFSGRIARLLASPGDVVKAGTPLAEIDSPDFGLAAADLAKARADEDHKRLTLDRARHLLSGGVIPLKDVESAQADFAQARAETTRATQRLRNLDPTGRAIGNGHFVLASPLAGVVTERTANPAMEIAPTLTQPLFVVSDLRHLWILVDLPERLLGKVATGAHVTIDCDAWPDRTFDATIVHIAQVLDPATRRVAVRARVDNDGLALRPEMFVRATVVSDRGRGVRVPNEALINEGLHTYVYVETGASTYRRVAVTLAVRGADASYVGSGLVGGEHVVVAGALLLSAEQSTAGGS